MESNKPVSEKSAAPIRVEIRSKSYQRALLGSSGLVFVALLVAAAGQLWAYFNTGANRGEALHLTTAMLETHTPHLHWLPDDPVTGRPMEEFTRQQIVGSYVRAWYQWQLSYLSGRPVGMKEHFTADALPKATEAVQTLAAQGQQLHQTDTDHQLQLHFYSADGQLVSFTDHRLTLKQRLYQIDPSEKLYATESIADYEVLMALEDGFWRIKHLVREKPGPLATPKPEPATATSFVQMRQQRFVWKGQPFQPVGVNYYPQKTPWQQFWTQFKAPVVREDFGRIRALGLNTVRIFVPFAEFGKGVVLPERLDQLQTVLDLADQNGLKVIVTLFDFMGDYRLLNLTATDRQLERVLTRLKQHPALLAWDLKNEPDLDFNHHDPDDVTDWLGWMLTRARRYDPNHLLTIGWAYPENAHRFASRVDFISFHSYKSPDVLATGIDQLRRKAPRKLLMLEEFGQSTYRGIWVPFGKSQTDQASYITQVRTVLKQRGNLPYLIWTLYDFSTVPAEVVGRRPWQREPQKHFGILDANGQPKPSANALKP